MSRTPSKGVLRRSSTSGVDNRSSRRSIGSPSSRNGVHFEPPDDLDVLLSSASENQPQLDGFVTHMKNQKGPGLVAWLQKVQENLAMLKPSLESFVMSILSIAWVDQDLAVVTAFRNFLVNLVSAQSYYTKPVIRMLVGNMVGSRDGAETAETFDRSHEALKAVIAISPLASGTALMNYCKTSMPYLLTPDTKAHTNYIANMVKIAKYWPGERVAILKIVFDRLIQLDAHLPLGEDLEDDEEDDEPAPVRERIARDNLDSAMVVVFEYIREKHGEGEAEFRALYKDLMALFESHVMPSYGTAHVQFLVFYAVSLDSAKFGGIFCEWLWRQFTSPATPTILRQSAVAYIASVIARAKFVSVDQLKPYLHKVVSWIHNYLDARSDGRDDYSFVDLRAHGAFYAACQAALYLLAFRHDELVHDRKHLAFLARLRLNRIVTCSLNPLKVCLPPVVKNFAAIARHYQLAYCETIIQRNSRLNLPVVGNLASATANDAKPMLLDTFFPFDPYRLPKSRVFVADIYREYQGHLEDENDDDDEDEDEKENEDELGEVEAMMKTPCAKRRRLDSSGSVPDFDYNVSPGFKR